MTEKRDDAPVPHSECANCGATLSARYCARCGQDSHVTLTVRHFFEEFIEGMTHFDSTFWRTFQPLLFKPGLLTGEFLDGKRKLYAPPLRSYLVLSVLYFLIASFSNSVHADFRSLDGRELGPADCTEMASRMQVFRWLSNDIEASCRRAMSDHGHALSTVIYGMLPKVMFVVLPLVALVQFWFYKRQRPLYVENLVFVLHFQSFYFLVSSLALLLATLIAWLSGATTQSVSSGFDFIIYAWSAAYLFLADRRVYNAGAFRAVASILAVGLAYLVFWAIGAGLVGMYAFLRS
jgi:hypothetical protein